MKGADSPEVPNPMILFDNHFTLHRRRYPIGLQFDIARHLGYQGLELHALEAVDPTWDAVRDAFGRSGLTRIGMYATAGGVADGESLDDEILRIRGIVRQLSRFGTRPYLALRVAGTREQTEPPFETAGSAVAEPRHWKRTQVLLGAVDTILDEFDVDGYLYNHVWFIIDTPEVAARTLAAVKARRLKLGLAVFHAHVHPKVPDAQELLCDPRLGEIEYVALLNARDRPWPFQTVALDEGQIDLARWLAELWARQYRGFVALQAWDLGGDPYESARRSIAYVQTVWARLQAFPDLNPATRTDFR
jgi:sugar phosphate isomerase/epimerase